MTEEVPKESNDQKNGNASDVSELDIAVIRQVEYYFGDLNLPRDKFLREQIKLDDGWIPLDVLTKFNRLAKLSTDTEVIANALEKSTSGLLEVSEDKKKIRRSPEMPLPEMNEERRKELMSRTAYAKGFPKDSSLDDLLKFFKEQGDVENLIMRKYLERGTKTRVFKGSVFAIFKTKEQAEKFVNNKDLKYGESELIIKWQSDYVSEKHDEYLARKEKREKVKTETNNVAEKEEKSEFKLPTGTVLHFTLGHNKMTRENVKDALTPLGADVAYIDYKQGETEGWVRLAKENTAKDIFEKITDGKLTINDVNVTFRVLEGDEEKTYLDKSIQEMVKRRKNQKNNKYNKSKSFRGKGKKRKQDQHDDEPPVKIKSEDS